MTRYKVERLLDSDVHQGDIIRNLIYYEKFSEEQGRFSLSTLKFPYSIVLTQECDLDNYNLKDRVNIVESQASLETSNNSIKQDKFLVSLLCAPLYNAEHLFKGEHLKKLNIETDQKSSDQKKYIKSNRDPRYHYMEFDFPSLVPLIIDFKHYFTISLFQLESELNHRVCTIQPIYRELISQRFSNFLSRIGLP